MELEKWCACKGHTGGWDYAAITNFYCNNFIPDGWYFGYGRLYGEESCRTIYLIGTCRTCGGIMRPGASLPMGLTGDGLIAEAYRMMRTYRPFDFKDGAGCYHGACTERADWYRSQDALTAQAIEAQFVPLFHKEDQSVARRWLRRHLSQGANCPDSAWLIGQILYWREDREPNAYMDPGALTLPRCPARGSEFKITDITLDNKGERYYAGMIRLDGKCYYVGPVHPDLLTDSPCCITEDRIDPVIPPPTSPGLLYVLLRGTDTDCGYDVTALAVSEDVVALRQALTEDLLDLNARKELDARRSARLSEGVGHNGHYFLSWTAWWGKKRFANYSIEPVAELDSVRRTEDRHG